MQCAACFDGDGGVRTQPRSNSVRFVTVAGGEAENARRRRWPQEKDKKKKLFFESCCGLCNLFPGVVFIAASQIIFSLVMMLELLNHLQYYDVVHNSKYVTLCSGAILSGMLGAGSLLTFAVFTDRGNVMMVYIYVAAILFFLLMGMSIFKLRECWYIRGNQKVKATAHSEQVSHLSCSWGLFTFLISAFYLFGVLIVVSFYYYRYARRTSSILPAEIREYRENRDSPSTRTILPEQTKCSCPL